MGRDVIEVTGPDAGTYLQGQLSQDVLALAVGASAPSLLLEPSGKLGYLLGVTRLGDTAFELDVDAGFGSEVVTRLERFKIRTDAQIVLQPAAGGTADAAQLDDEELERIRAGRPRAGAEITDGVIPAELGNGVIDATVSFTKGCYTGQELVARVDSRGGNVPRHLRLVTVEGARTPPAGAEVVVGDDVVGALTSVAADPAGGTVALAFVRRAVVPPAAARVRWPEGSADARIAELPPA